MELLCHLGHEDFPGISGSWQQLPPGQEDRFPGDADSRYETDEDLVVETIPPSKPELVRRMSFSEVSGATRVIDRLELNTGQPRLLQKLATGRVKSAVAENLGKLRQLLETGEVTLQDGRLVRS